MKETKIIKCRNCGKEFEFTGGEQSFYEEKGFAVPVRCKECRNARKAANAEKVEEPKSPSLDELWAKFEKNTVKFDK